MRSEAEVAFLLVDDDEVNVIAMRRALLKLKLTNSVVVAKNGVEGLAALQDAEAVRYIVLLDFHMPGMDGQEFLEQLEGNRALQASLVTVLTTSEVFEEQGKPLPDLVAGHVGKHDVYGTLKAALDQAGLHWRIVPAPGKATVAAGGGGR